MKKVFPMILIILLFISTVVFAVLYYTNRSGDNGENTTQSENAGNVDENFTMVLTPFDPAKTEPIQTTQTTTKADDKDYNLSIAPDDTDTTQNTQVTQPSVNATTVAGDTWDETKAYNGGETVVYNGKTYSSKWWTQGDIPGAGGDADPWKLV